MHYKYLKNLSEHKTYAAKSLTEITTTPKKFTDKIQRRTWSNHPDTDYAFYSLFEGNVGSTRISKRGENKVCAMWVFVVEYDNITPDWDTLVDELLTKCGPYPPTVITRTPSGGVRLIWEFEDKLLIDDRMFKNFINRLADRLKVRRLFAGFDESCLLPHQYFYLGEIIHTTNKRIPEDFYVKLLIKTGIENPPQAPSSLSIPLDAVETEVRENTKYNSRWPYPFEVGVRGPLFWIDDGIEREGCQITQDGMICYSDRAGKGFLTWKEIFGEKFVEDYENKKLDYLIERYWFTGKTFYTKINDRVCMIDKDQLKLELRQAGFNKRASAGKPLSELENAILIIQRDSRIDEVAPIVFDESTVVQSGPNKILNTSTLKAIQPAGDSDKKKWPFIEKWLKQFFKDEQSLNYFYAWLQRIYSAVLYKDSKQGHALLLVGPTNKGKSLLSNKLIGGLLGGFADASDYLSGDSKFNKELGQVAAWVIDDTTSAASFAEQRRATELIKKATANPRIEYQAKFENSITISWAGRVIMSLNMDATSLSVIPALDSSNRDKIIALRISDDATSDFAKLLNVVEASNTVIESTMEEELPHFAQWLLEYVIPKDIKGDSRFGIKSHIDPEIDAAAFANSNRSVLIEAIEFFSETLKEYGYDKPVWKGTVVKLMAKIQDLNGNKPLNNLTSNMGWMIRGMQSLEEASKADKDIRPITSVYKNNLRIYSIDLDSKWDISTSDD